MGYREIAPDRWSGQARRTRTRGEYSTLAGQLLDGLCCLAMFGAIPAIMAIVGVGL